MVGTLNDVLEQDGCLPEPVVWSFLLQLASGLFHLHDSGVLYCDMRPVKVSGGESGGVGEVSVRSVWGECEEYRWR